MIKPQTLKGFRDFLPKEARKRQYVINTLKEVFELYGFEPLETPALEYEEILLGKYGEEGDRLMYRFTDRGGRKVALRYDQTVPLARVVAQYQNELPIPFKRYQIQPVWRAENPQKGRFREFLQCDADIVGSSSPLADAEIIAVAVKSLEKLGFKNFKILINDRSIFFSSAVDSSVSRKDIPSIVRTIDKIKKFGRNGVIAELIKKGFGDQGAKILNNIENSQPTKDLNLIESYLKGLNIAKDKVKFTPTLARGLDYYTNMIFEIEVGGYTAGSVCGGGRYDTLVGFLLGKYMPAVGFSFGFDRLMEAMDELNLFPQDLVTTKVLVTIFSPDLKEKSLEVTSLLRAEGINAELYLNENASLEKQLKYADQKGISYAVIVGPDEVGKDLVTLRSMRTREQKQIPSDKLINEFK